MKSYLGILGLIILVIFLGTIIDFVAHQTSPRFWVPWEYYPNKILFGSLWGFLAILIAKRYTQNPKYLAFWMSLFVAVILQTKYFLQGYDRFFVFNFMILHFLMFLAPGIWIFKKYEKVLLE
jgi:hypothetical protein